MKKHFAYIGLAMFGLGLTPQSYAAMCSTNICNEYHEVATQPENCYGPTTPSASCYWSPTFEQYFVQNECVQCNSGYKLVRKTHTDVGCTIEYATCESESTGCDPWQQATGNPDPYAYEYRDCGNSLTEVRCRVGYYGVPPLYSFNDDEDVFSGCTKCPANASCPGATATFRCLEGYYRNGNECAACPRNPAGGSPYSPMNSTDVTACYIMSGTSFSETSGQGVYTGDCRYVK